MADESFMQEFLEAHNAYRTKHGAPPLEYNDELNAAAQQWADHLLATGLFMHSNTRDGENLYSMYSSANVELTGKEAVDTWYSEIKNYNFSYPGFSGSTGHFTQVVWKETTELGVGLSTNGNKVYVVGKYRPPGNMNMPGYFAKNVLREVMEEEVEEEEEEEEEGGEEEEEEEYQEGEEEEYEEGEEEEYEEREEEEYEKREEEE